MIEDRVYFKTGDLTLEGLFAPSPGTKGAVIAHPHPLMGGSMRDPVVIALVTLLHQTRRSTLRFNFRGVGRSEGHFDNGVGEVDDVSAAVEFLFGQGITDILLVGYSFGALAVMTCHCRLKDSTFAVLVSPPVSEMNIDVKQLIGKRGLMVCGEKDPFCPIDDLKRIAESIGWELGIVPDADHFYWGRQVELMETIGSRLPRS